MSTLDLVILIFIGLFTIYGFKEGAWKSILNLLVLVIAIAMSFFYLEEVSVNMAKYISFNELSFYPLYVFMVLFISLIGWIFVRLFNFIFSGVNKSFINRLIGGVVGIIISIIIIFLLLSLLGKQKRVAEDDLLLGGLLLATSTVITPFIPPQALNAQLSNQKECSIQI